MMKTICLTFCTRKNNEGGLGSVAPTEQSEFFFTNQSYENFKINLNFVHLTTEKNGLVINCLKYFKIF